MINISGFKLGCAKLFVVTPILRVFLTVVCKQPWIKKSTSETLPNEEHVFLSAFVHERSNK